MAGQVGGSIVLRHHSATVIGVILLSTSQAHTRFAARHEAGPSGGPASCVLDEQSLLIGPKVDRESDQGADPAVDADAVAAAQRVRLEVMHRFAAGDPHASRKPVDVDAIVVADSDMDVVVAAGPIQRDGVDLPVTSAARPRE